ncbi:MAG: class I SAM-dependent methyltransferase [Anaerolineales bacterium]|nr:class I SAM-dependent methyltransferase [Anaerolineales bacterium]
MFDHFNILAPIYERVIKAKLPERLVELVDINSVERMLDAGGGTGRVSQFFSDQVEQIVIADSSFQMLAKSKSKNGLYPVNSNSEILPFPDESFDRIIMVDALHHVYDQSKTARELWRVIKPGGKIVIEEPDIHNRSVKLIALAEKLALMRSHFLSGQEIQALFSSFPAVIEIHQEDHFVWVVVDKKQSKI